MTSTNITAACSRVSIISHSSDPSTNQVRPQSIETGSVRNNYESTLYEDYESIQTSEDSDASSNNLKKTETEYEKNLIFRNNLRQWAINKNISLEALRELIVVVNQRLPGVLPVDPRTLLQTKRNVVIKKIEGGEYWHKGLIEPLKDIIFFLWLEIPESIQLNLNFDGLPIYNSSKKEFWPILCNIYEKPEIEPLVVGIYYGSGKPKILSQYLEDFVAETESLGRFGVATVIRVCNFNSRHGCLKCTTVGEYSHQYHTVVFPNSRCPKRTNEEFRNNKYRDHLKSDTPLLKLPIDMIEDFPISDSLHLIDLGVMKRLLVGWHDGNFKNLTTKWRADDTLKVTQFLLTSKRLTESDWNVKSKLNKAKNETIQYPVINTDSKNRKIIDFESCAGQRGAAAALFDVVHTFCIECNAH
ncbi:unnamed protein product [Chilo suppressalis]|uniref:Uncharacterized protein n=1 Tax=Chilo suppressalis TaxID=168631 RepID=A0ABN8AXU9_CHISP|nr:unnamed protein product [Chilo suppressalis]